MLHRAEATYFTLAPSCSAETVALYDVVVGAIRPGFRANSPAPDAVTKAFGEHHMERPPHGA
jgi:hypothetical protein